MQEHKISPEQEQERLEKFRIWLETFAKLNFEQEGKSISFVNEKMPEVLNEVYWGSVKDYIHPNITDRNGIKRSNQYKIISGTELSIILVQPISHENPVERRKLNAELAWFISLTIYQTWEKNEANAIEEDLFVEILKNPEVAEFKNEHLIWLDRLDPEFEYPIFCNSQVWRLFDTSIRLLAKQFKLSVAS